MVEKRKNCFVICPIGEEGTPTRDHSDTVFEGFIEPALEAVGGFDKPVRADHIPTPGNITKQVVEHIANDDLVIADLTDRNANVFYELGIRHTLGKPFVQMIHKEQDIPFDVGQNRTIKFDPKDIRGSKKVIAKLRDAVEACFAKGYKAETPLGYSVTLDNLERGDLEARTLKIILEKLDQLLTRVPVPSVPPSEVLRALDAAPARPVLTLSEFQRAMEQLKAVSAKALTPDPASEHKKLIAGFQKYLRENPDAVAKALKSVTQAPPPKKT